MKLLQLVLLEESWKDVFLLSLAQWNIPLEVQNILECARINQDKLPSDKMASLFADIRNIRELVGRLRSMHVDTSEYACLKAIVLFKAGKLNILVSFKRAMQNLFPG